MPAKGKKTLQGSILNDALSTFIGVLTLNAKANTSNAIFNLSFYSNYNHKIKLRIVNIIGEVILKQVINVQIGDFRKEINLDNYPNSIYFLELETDNGLIIKKLVLQD